MIRSIFFFFSFLFTTLTFAQGISFFHGSWEEALEEAEKTDKIIFVDAYAKWCGPCKVMAKNVFTQDKVGDFFNKNFISLKLDMEEKEGVSFGRKFPISAFPTLFFLDPKGALLHKAVGGKKAEDLLLLASKAMQSYDKSDKFAEMYEGGSRDFDLMVNYVRELNKVGKPSLKISNEYMNSKPDISDDQKAEFLLAAVTEADSKLFDQMITFRRNILNLISKEEYAAKIERACLKTVDKAVEYDFEDLLVEAIQKHKDSKAGDDKRFEQVAQLEYNQQLANFEEWKGLSKKYLKKYGKKNPDLYKEHLSILEKSFSYIPEYSEYANDVAKQLIKKEDSTNNYMLYIKMLAKCNKTKEAIKVTEEAIKKAKSRNEQTKQLESYLDYIKKEDLD